MTYITEAFAHVEGWRIEPSKYTCAMLAPLHINKVNFKGSSKAMRAYINKLLARYTEYVNENAEEILKEIKARNAARGTGAIQ